METQKNWLDEEAKNITTPTDYEELPSLKLTPNVVTEIVVDFSKPFQKWEGDDTNGKSIIKKIIPVSVSGTRMYWWLNVKNPVYKEIITLGQKNVNTFKVLQTGTQKNTKYVLVK